MLQFIVQAQSTQDTNPTRKQVSITYILIFFSEGMITNPAIWTVLCVVRIFISLPTGTVTLLRVTQNIPNFVDILHEYLLFSQLGSVFKRSIFKLVKPINHLFILSFLTLKLLRLPKTNCFLNEFVVAYVS